MDFRDWWASNASLAGAICDDVVGGVYHANKFDNKGRPTRFLNESVESVYKLNIEVAAQEDTPIGVSDVYVALTERKAPFWTFFVYPAVKPDMRSGKKLDYPLADHLTFCLDASDERRPNHFHSTEYAILMTGASTRHTKNFMSDPVEIPARGTRTRLLDKQPAWMKSLALAVMRLPYTIGGQDGGSGRGITSTKRKRPRVETLREELYGIMRDRGITRLTWFGVRYRRKWHYSVDIIDIEPREPIELEDGLYFALSSSAEVDVLQKLVDALGE